MMVGPCSKERSLGCSLSAGCGEGCGDLVDSLTSSTNDFPQNSPQETAMVLTIYKVARIEMVVCIYLDENMDY